MIFMKKLALTLSLIILSHKIILAGENDQIQKDANPTVQDSVKQSLISKAKELPVELKFYGFIRQDLMYDTRQTVDVREGSVLMWAADAKFDKNGKDINSASQLQMLAVLSRVGLKFSVNNILNAKASGLLEGDYFGNAETGINEFRLRHAWITLDWKKTQLGIGQYWHPLTIPEMFPGTVNFSGGAPYMPFNRNPQIRLTQKITPKLDLQLTILSQRDFTANTAPYINSAVPSSNLILQYKSAKLFLGASGHFEQLRPKLSSGSQNLYSNERVNSFSTMAYAKYVTKPVTIKAQAVLSQNASSFIMLGGFVGYTPNNGGVEVYKTMNTQSYWIEFAGNGKTWVPGLFAGYSKNNGTKNNGFNAPNYSAMAYGFPAAVSGIGAGTGSRTINHIYRIAPRLEYRVKSLKFGLEAEYSLSQWGDGNYRGVATNNINNINNLRINYATIFSF